MVKINIEYDTEIDRWDSENMAALIYHADLISCITSALSHIRQRIKYNENVSDEEVKTLETIREMLTDNLLSW